MSSSWTRRAPCKGQDDFAPRDDAWRSADDLKRLCRTALDACGPCPFRAACIATVMPAQAKFDGVAGGRIWCNGEVIAALPDTCDEELAEPKLRASCGTEAGAKDHNRHGERACSSCCQVSREISARRKQDKAKQEQLQLELPFAA